MFAFLRRTKKPDARPLLDAVMAAARRPALYLSGGVPDTLDGRFELLLLHVFPIFDRLQTTDFAQALYDETFKRLEFGLRELTVGDMGIPHKIRRMMTAYNGRMAAYHDACAAGDYRPALARNLFGTRPDVTNETLSAWDAYTKHLYETIANAPLSALESGQVNWPEWSAT